MKPSRPTGQPGRVAVNFGAQCLVELEDGSWISCHIPRQMPRPVCGDHVSWSRSGAADQGVLTGMEKRRNELLRHDAHKQKRVLAANLDCLLLVLAPQPEPDLALLDRYLVAAELLRLRVRLVFNKADLLDPNERDRWQQRLAPYTRLGYELGFASTRTGLGLEALRSILADSTGVVVGQSGVGKSSLVSALVPDLELRTQSLSVASGAGQHTTSATRLYSLPDRHGYIIDSPGVRDFRLWPLRPHEIEAGFRELRGLGSQCRFTDCRHRQEPDCAVRAQVQAGQITEERYASYCQLLEWMSRN